MLSNSTDHQLSRQIAARIAALEGATMPVTTMHATRRALLDALGVMLAATGLASEATPFRKRALADGGVPQARLLGETGQVPAAAAAFANGALAHALDFGDTYDAGPAHPNAALVPALLALADADPAISVGQLLVAMAAGSDLACRMSLAGHRPYEEGGWYPPPLFGAIAAAAGCAKLLGLDTNGIVQAMGLAMLQATFPGEIKHDRHTALRAVREAFAARAAVSAALLARDGVRGLMHPLEGKAGFFALYAGGHDPAVLLGGAGFVGDRVSFKPWPSCRGTHPYIEAALKLRRLFDWRDVVSIEAEIGPVQEMLVEPHSHKARPGSAIDAKFSIPFTVASAMVHGHVDLDSFGPARLADPDVLQVAAVVAGTRNPAWTRAHAASGALRITLGDGTAHRHTVLQALGHPDRPLSDAALTSKFVQCLGKATPPITPARAWEMAETILTCGEETPAHALPLR